MKHTFFLIFVIFLSSLSVKSQDISELHNTVDLLFSTDKAACLKQAHNLEKLALKQKNDTSLSFSYNIQARIYYINKKYSKSIKYFEKELNINKNNIDKHVLAESQYNLGSTCLKLRRNSKAKSYFEQSLKLSKTIKYEMLIYANNEALYNISVKLNDYRSALKYFKELQSFDEEEYNQSIGLFQKKYFEQKSIAAKKERELNKTSKRLNKTKSSLYNTKNRLNRTNNELDSAETQVALLQEDSMQHILNMNSLKIQSKYAELENELILESKKEELRQQRRYTITFIGAFAIILALSLFMYKLFLTKKKMNKNLVKQKDKITEQHFQINNSIKYAQKIQNAVLVSNNLIDNVFSDYFIFFKPRDIVSGDFYWFYKKDDIFWGAVVDCTGHGVPGALMSMVGNSLLNRIIREPNIDKPSSLLMRLNEEVKITLNQNNSAEISEDGMDMSVIRVDLKQKNFNIALANHTAFIVKDDKINTIEGDIFSIGDSLSNSHGVSFNDHTFKYDNNTKLYMFSDGFQDQFGGENDKKYTQQRLKNKLLDIKNENFKTQQKIMAIELNNWADSTNQIDDILLVGIHF